MGNVLERCAFTSHDHVCEQRILPMHVETSFNCRNDGHTNTQQILENLDSFIVHLAPHRRIGHISERREVDPGDEVSSGSGENDDCVGAVLAHTVEPGRQTPCDLAP